MVSHSKFPKQSAFDARSRAGRRISPFACIALLTGCQLLGGFEDFSGTQGAAGSAGNNGSSGQGGSGSIVSGGGAAGKSGDGSIAGDGDGGASGSAMSMGGSAMSMGGSAMSMGGSTVSMGGGTSGSAGASTVGGTGQGGAGGQATAGTGGSSAGGASSGAGGTAPKCGNGLLDPGEGCDDGNTSACGQCSVGCTVLVQPAFATGSVQVEAPLGSQNLVDGDTFTLNDGVHPAVVFEFDKSPVGVKAGHVAVPYTGQVGSEATLAKAIFTAIDTVSKQTPAVLDVLPTYVSQRVDLKHRYATSLGNKPITSTVNAALFLLDGMSGGLAGDCAVNVGCEYPGDCAPGLKCMAEKCVVGP